MLALVVTVPESEIELAADVLWALGVLAVEEREGDGMVELWTSLGDDPGSLARAAEAFPARWRWHTVEVDAAVAESWRQHATPSWITPDLVVVPDWIDATIDPGVTAVRIDPGDTFGLGDHPTSVLTLRALSGLLWPDATVLDVGCGSGVLAVGAAVLGASYVEAVDISTAAVTATVDNARRNGVAAKVVASTTPLADVVGPFDVVCANILAPALIELAGDLRRVTAPSGVLVVSGILEGANDHVVDALSPMQVVDRLHREGWAAVVLRH
jgi:ribosomal protein L11 methyltransferase